MDRTIFSRDFLLSFSSQFTSTFINSILIPTLPIYLAMRGGRAVEIGILIGIFSVSSLLCRPFVGRRLLVKPEKRFMLMGSAFYLLSSLGYVFVRPFWPLFVVRTFHGIGFALFATSVFTLITRIAPDAHRGQAVAYFFMAINLASALAPAFGIFVMNAFGFNALFLVCAVLSISMLIFLPRLSASVPACTRAPAGGGGPLFSRAALCPSIITLIANIIWGAITAFFPLYALTYDVKNPGFFFAAYAGTLVLARAAGGRILDLYPREKVMVPCFAAQFSAMVLLAFSTNLGMFILVALLWGIGSSYLFPGLVLYAVERVGPSERGPAMGTYTAFGDFGAGMGAVIMGIALEWASYRTMFLFLALSSLVNFVYFYFSLFTHERKNAAGWVGSTT
jgi:MFS family permease